MSDETASVPCNCILDAHCAPARPGCRLKAGATINQGGGICGPYQETQHCIDCDRADRDCACEDVLRCSCGIPDSVCVCAGNSSRRPMTDEIASVQACPRCEGTGQMKNDGKHEPKSPLRWYSMECSRCGGSGQMVPTPSDEAVIAVGLDAVSWGEIQQGAADPREAAAYAIRAALAAIDLPRVRAEARAARTAEIEAWLRELAESYVSEMPRGAASKTALLNAADAIAAKFNPENR